MNRFVRSPAYVKVRAVTGTLFIALGALLVGRTVTTVGLGLSALVPLVMGAALMGLGAIRVRDYFRLRSGAQ